MFGTNILKIVADLRFYAEKVSRSLRRVCNGCNAHLRSDCYWHISGMRQYVTHTLGDVVKGLLEVYVVELNQSILKTT